MVLFDTSVAIFSVPAVPAVVDFVNVTCGVVFGVRLIGCANFIHNFLFQALPKQESLLDETIHRQSIDLAYNWETNTKRQLYGTEKRTIETSNHSHKM